METGKLRMDGQLDKCLASEESKCRKIGLVCQGKNDLIMLGVRMVRRRWKIQEVKATDMGKAA